MSIKSLNPTNKTVLRTLHALKQTYVVVRWSLPIILLGMILARMVWMQQRQYPISNRLPALATQMDISVESANECAAGPRSEIVYPFERLSVAVGPLLDFAGWTSGSQLAEQYYRMLCGGGTLVPLNLIRFNQWCWVGVVFFASLTLRFVSGSWFLPLVAATALMSRGDLMTQIGNLSGSVIEMLCATFWFCCMVHFMRTGSWLTFAMGSMAVIAGTVFNPVLAFLFLAMPAMLLVGKLTSRFLDSVVMENLRRERRRVRMAAARTAQSVRDDDGVGLVLNYTRRILGLHDPERSQPGSRRPAQRRSRLFSTTSSPFAIWAYQSDRWQRIALIGSVLFLCSLLYLAVQMILATQDIVGLAETALPAEAPQALRRLAFHGFSNHLDFHYFISCIVLVVSAVQSPVDGLVGSFETVWLLIFSILAMMIGAMAVTWFGISVSPFGQLSVDQLATVLGEPLKYAVISMEGLIIALAIGGIYNLIKATDSLLFRSNPE
jgi:hypothetical protein